jgi:hypothetical protein
MRWIHVIYRGLRNGTSAAERAHDPEQNDAADERDEYAP